MGDDAAGPRLAAPLERSPASGWQVVDGGSAPENVVHRVRALAPDGFSSLMWQKWSWSPASPSHQRAPHRVPEVHFLGIQPSLVGFGCPFSAAVEKAVLGIHTRLQQGATLDSWPKFAELSQDLSAGAWS